MIKLKHSSRSRTDYALERWEMHGGNGGGGKTAVSASRASSHFFSVLRKTRAERHGRSLSRDFAESEIYAFSRSYRKKK